MRRAWIAAAMLLAFGVLANSQPPAPSKFVGGQHKQNKAETSQGRSTNQIGGSEESPVFVEKVESAQENKETDAEANYKNTETTWNRRYQIATIIMSFFTVALAFINGGMWFSGKETAKRQLRAYVSLKQIDPKLGADGRHTEAIVVLKNNGQTPAYEVVHRSDFLLTDISYSGEFRLKESTPRFMIGPGVESLYRHVFKLTAEDVKMLRAGTKAVWVFGEVVYKDAFFKKHVTRYRSLIGGKHSEDIEHGMFFIADEGNCEDEYCQ